MAFRIYIISVLLMLGAIMMDVYCDDEGDDSSENAVCYQQNVIVLQSGGGGFLSGTSVSEAGLTQGDYVDGGLCFHAPSPPNQGEVVICTQTGFSENSQLVNPRVNFKVATRVKLTFFQSDDHNEKSSAVFNTPSVEMQEYEAQLEAVSDNTVCLKIELLDEVSGDCLFQLFSLRFIDCGPCQYLCSIPLAVNGLCGTVAVDDGLFSNFLFIDNKFCYGMIGSPQAEFKSRLACVNTLLPDEFSSKVTVKTDFCVDALIGSGLNLTVYVKEDQSISGTKIVTTAGDHQLSVELVTHPKQDRTICVVVTTLSAVTGPEDCVIRFGSYLVIPDSCTTDDSNEDDDDSDEDDNAGDDESDEDDD